MKNIIAFLLGAAVGGAGVYFYLKNREEDYINSEVELMRDYYEKAKKELTDTADELRDISDEAKTFVDRQNSVDYVDFYRDNEVVASVPVGESVEEEVTDSVGKSTEPKLIKKDEYYHDGMYNKVALSYFTGNDVLFNEEEGEVVDDVKALLGDTLTRYGFVDNDEEEVIHVRNYERMTDYEVEKLFASYS